MFTRKLGGWEWGWTIQDKTNERKMTYSFRGEFDNPWWRNYKIGMSSQITHFIYLLHLETLYSVVVLKRNQLVIQFNVQVYYITLGQGSKNNSMLEKRPSYHTETQHYVNFFGINTIKNQPFNSITKSLTAALHQEQLIAMISCLKKDNHLLQYKWYITQFEWSIKGCIHTGFLQRVPNSGNA